MGDIGTDIDFAAQCLNSNQVVGIPTETVYGLAGNALSIEAISKIYEVKDRPSFDPLIAHVPSLASLHTFVKEVPEKAMALADEFWPGPLTMLFEKNERIPDLLTSGSPKVAIRIPDHPMTLALLKALDFPLAAPSANPFGYVSPTSAKHVQDQLGDKVPYILNGGSASVGIESTIVSIQKEKTIIHRLGGLPIEAIEKVVGPVKLELNQSSNPVAPGMIKSHYAPHKKVIIGDIEQLIEEYRGEKIAVLSYKDQYPIEHNCVLSKRGSLIEAASHLFQALRQLDALNIDVILTEFFPDEGLGRAVNDRLARAAAK